MSSAKIFGIKVIRDYTYYEQCSCPYHTDHSPSAVFLKNENIFYCYSCHRRKTMIELARDLKLTADDIADDIDGVGPALPNFFDSKPEFIERFEPVENSINAMAYLYERDIDESVYKYYNLEYSTLNKSIVFPQNFNNKRIGNVHRLMGGVGGSRYVIMGKKEGLWPNKFYDMDLEYMFISEGAFKAMKIYQGLKMLGGEKSCISVCTNGSHLGFGAQEFIEQFKGKVIMVADNDEPGIKFGKKMKNFCTRVTVPKIPFDEMSDSLVKDTLENIIRTTEDEKKYNF